MTPAHEIRLGKALQDAWNMFLRAPEVYAVISFAVFGAFYVFSRAPFSSLLSLMALSFLAPAIFLVARADLRNGKGDFSAIAEIWPLLPQIWLTAFIRMAFVTLGLLCFIFPGIYLAVCYLFATIMVLEEKKTFWEALESSRRLVQQRWLEVFGVWLFTNLLFFSGLLLVGIGVLVTAPIAILTIYCAYREIIRGGVVVE